VASLGALKNVHPKGSIIILLFDFHISLKLFIRPAVVLELSTGPIVF